MNMMIKSNKYYLWLIMLMGVFYSCTKTEYTDYEVETANRILEYRLTNTQQELLGAIDNSDNTITVYIPYYLGIEYLNAEIKLDEGAKLLDSTGAEINLVDGELTPVLVNPDSVSVKYTVVPVNGESRTYTLIQKVLPYPEELRMKYADFYEEIDTSITEHIMPVNFQMLITGNFESTSTNVKITLKDKTTGEVHNDWILPQSMEVAARNSSTYTLTTLISPEALAGDYEVQVEHQGRVGSLPDLKLVYTRSRGAGYGSAVNFSSATASYAPGDTVVLAAAPSYSIASGYDGGIFLPMDRAYIKIQKTYPGRAATPEYIVPDDFPEELFGKEIELQIVNQSRSEVKFIFPDIPAGSYQNNRTGGFERLEREDGRTRLNMPNTNFSIYVDWADNTGWGKNFLFAYTSVTLFTVNPK